MPLLNLDIPSPLSLTSLFLPILFLLLTPTTALTIPAVPTWPSGRCTDKSLTIPSWLITDFKIVAGNANFKADNRAAPIDGWINIDCPKGKKQCSGSAATGELDVMWEENADGTYKVEFRHFWVCEDEGDRVIFTGTGNTTITECKGPDCVSPITYLAPGTLSLPVPLEPKQPEPPAGFDKESCPKVGENQWSVTDVSYRNYTKGQCKQWYSEEFICIDPVDFIPQGEHFSLNVTNNVISHEVRCSFTPNYERKDLPRPLRCTGGKFNEITVDVTLTGTAPNFNLKVEELWYCLENPRANTNPTAIVASGNADLKLSCTTSTGITGKPDDIVTICTDSSSPHSVNGKQVEKQTLPPYSLITAWPAHGGCTFDSVVNPTWYYRGMFFETKPFPKNDPNSATLARFKAGLTGPGFQDYFFYENKAISGSGVNTVYTCAVYYDGKPKDQHWNCTYSFNPHTKVITQEKVWECKDKNPSQPLYFSGSGNFDWTWNPIMECTGPTLDYIRCYWHGDHANLPPGTPYDVPRITASLTNILPPDYGQPGFDDTVRVQGKWQLLKEVKAAEESK